MKEKMKRRVQIRHEISDYGKVDRQVVKSLKKEATHKLETSTRSTGFFTSIKKMVSKMFGFFRKKQPIHNGRSTKSYCKKFGGAFGGKKSSTKLYHKLATGKFHG